MEVVNTIVGKMLEPMIELLFTSTRRQIGYVFHYKHNIKNFEDEVENLRACLKKVQDDVEMARDNGMVVEEDVSKWLEKVERSLITFEEEKKLLQDRQNLCCLDVCSRHQLGREGKKKTLDVTGLKDEGKFERLAHSPRLTDIWNVSSTNFEQFESRNSVFNEIMEAMKDSGSYKIGIYGMPGVGKTTMVEEVGKQAEKGLFDEVAMAVFSQTPDLRKIQVKLADCLNLTLTKESEEGSAGELRNRLKNGRKILVILDDVWDDQTTLKKIGIPDDIDNSKGCKILLTSRRLEVCRRMGFEKNFEIGLLSKPEAWKLFKRTVGDYIEADREMLSVAGKVCRECGCLPLAILAIGAALKGEKGKHMWDDAHEQLRNSQGYKIEGVPEKLYSNIEWSYDYLKQTDLQLCFLHCCLFSEDTEISIDDLVKYGVGTGFLRGLDTMKKKRDRAKTLVSILKKSNLLLEGKDENFVKLHDVIRDVAILIASKDPNVFLVKDAVNVWPENDDYRCCMAISLRTSHDVGQLPYQLVCRELRTLVLGCNTTDGLELELPSSFFELMEKLEILDLYRINLLQSSLSNLVNLRMLRLRKCKLVDLSFLKNFKKLEILRIDDYYVEPGVIMRGYDDYDFKHKLMVDEVGQLHHLRSLDLRKCNCQMAETFQSGVLSHLSGLEELYLPLRFEKRVNKGNVSIAELHCLSSLNSLHILHIWIPEHIILLPSFQSLTTFHIWIGFPDWMDEYRCNREYTETKILGLKNVPWKVEYNVLMKNVEVLYLLNSEGAKKVLHHIDREWFLELKSLVVEKWVDMEHHLLGKPHGPCPLGSFGKLSELEVGKCGSIKYLFSPSTASGLSNLQKLIIKNCEMLEEIVGGDEEVVDKLIFHQLKVMRLDSLSNLRSIYSNTKKISTSECNTSTIEQALFNEKVTFPVLEILIIEKLSSITAIWDKQLLPIQEAENSFEHLQQLHVEDCEKIERIVAFRIGQGEEADTSHEIAMFTKLKILSLKKLPSLKSFCQSHGSKKEETSEQGISQLQALFFNRKVVIVAVDLVTFPMLEELRLSDGSLFEHIWTAQIPASSSSKLRVLQVAQNRKLVKFPPNLLQRFEAVEELTLFECWSLEAVVAFNREGLNAIVRQGFLVFNNLTTLRVHSCKSLKYLFSLSIATTGLTQLRRLTIMYCDSIEEIVRNEEGGAEDGRDKIVILFPRLEDLGLKRLPNLRSFCEPNNIAFQLPSLNHISVHNCDQIGTTSGGTSFFGHHLHKTLEQTSQRSFVLRTAKR
ncbi:probable disease resistance protein At4g27220 [Cornus florida]|uniref:probable disease resistance protein At4g27220 n=1 Tax=Cornus florida TaxID=4283 RepID=UPI00289FA361|nr:probable disease resistance protein At4g27220 [Cornus florida]